MGHRFFVETPISSDRATLTDSESHHLQHVMRATVGDEITLFDGSGREFSARIDNIKRSQVNLTVTSTQEINREAPRQITVGVALPKGDRQRWLIEKLTELGVAQVVPLRTERSVVHPDHRSLKKLNRFVIEASKQCGRNQLMEILPLTSLQEFLASAPALAVRWMADPAGNLAGSVPARQDAAYLAVGPEGGFSPQEQQAADVAGWQTVSLGPRILRIETACAVLTTLVSADVHHA